MATWHNIANDASAVTAVSGFAAAILLVNGIALWFLLPETKGVPLSVLILLGTPNIGVQWDAIASKALSAVALLSPSASLFVHYWQYAVDWAPEPSDELLYHLSGSQVRVACP